ncbi:MAG: Rpn family recombination-promoting nuclease/putative transposase [Lachnospiraceae bacterium]|nr:Rpn family recombination-promoting nuclease/putative transposase [Lachnospiraceae bacterium]
MGAKDVALKKYLSDNRRFTDLINGVAFKGREVLHVDEIKEKDTNSVYKENKRVFSRQRDILKKVEKGSYHFYIACENQMEVHYGMPIRTMMYNGITYDEQIRNMKKVHNERKDWKDSAEFLSGLKESDKLMAVITFVCYYGDEEWNSNLSLKDMVFIPREYRDFEPYLVDYHINLIPMMKVDPDVFHGELRELIALLQCNSDIQKIKELIQSDDRYRYLSEETFEVFMVLSDEKASLKKLKKYARFNRERKVEYDMCRAFEQLRASGREEGIREERARLNQLYSQLLSEKRYDDLERAIADETFRKELYDNMQVV